MGVEQARAQKLYGDHSTTEIKGHVKVEHQKVDDLELARWIALVLTNGAVVSRN